MNHPLFNKIHNNVSNHEINETDIKISPKKDIIIDDTSKEVPDFNKKVLTSEESLLFQLSLEKQKTGTLIIEKLTVILQSKKLVIQNYDLRIKQINDDIQTITNQIKQSQNILKEIKEAHVNLTKTLENKYALDSGWQFDSDTGEITYSD